MTLENLINNKKPIDTQGIVQGLSVIVPTFNGALWLPETIKHIEASLHHAKIKKCEILVINDGSQDNTVEVVTKLALSSNYVIRIITQANGGRFMARRTGTKGAKYPNLLFVDTRVYIGEESLKYIVEQNSLDSTRNVWCSHVRVNSTGNIYARFWDAIAFVAWRKYFKNPRDVSYGIKDFDNYPKGTTCFFIKKDILEEANSWFIKNTKDIKTSNDDTLLIRHIAEKNSINVSPDFWCLYHARTSIRQYTKHVFHRGRVFVDGFLRNDGNRFFWPLIIFLVLSVIVPVFLVFNLNMMSVFILFGLAGWIAELMLVIALGVPTKDSLSLFILSPIFAVFYGLGIWRAVLDIYVLKPNSS